MQRPIVRETRGSTPYEIHDPDVRIALTNECHDDALAIWRQVGLSEAIDIQCVDRHFRLLPCPVNPEQLFAFEDTSLVGHFALGRH